MMVMTWIDVMTWMEGDKLSMLKGILFGVQRKPISDVRQQEVRLAQVTR